MWFKRHRKPDQDHALSESLKSLQSLLSETGRREPNLDPRDTPPEDPGVDTSPEGPAGPRPPRAADAAAGARQQTEQRTARTGESGSPEGAANRWRDLNLSFDAEPVLSRARRGDEAGTEDRSTGAEPDVEPGAGARPPAPAVNRSESADPADAGRPHVEAADEVPDVSSPDTEEDRIDPGEAGPAVDPRDAGGDEALPDYQGRADPDGSKDGSGAPSRVEAAESGDEVTTDYEWSRQDEEVLVLDLEDPEPSPAVVPGTPGAGPVDAVQPVPDASPGHTDPAAEDSVAASPLDENAEDQLHLELEPDDMSDADIPVLTDAVYVPDAPPEHPVPEPLTPPGPPDSPHTESVVRCIDNLRVRFQLMGLDALSPEQEKELHDTLVEFLDDLRHE